MRPIERIPIVMEKMFHVQMVNRRYEPGAVYTFITDSDDRVNIAKRKFDIMYYWMQNPDQRFGQVLFNLGLTDDSKYNIEEDDWLISNGYCNVEDVKFWTSQLDENNQRLAVPRKRLLKDLDINHIRNIIKFFEDRGTLTRMDGKCLEYFDERIYDDEHSN